MTHVKSVKATATPVAPTIGQTIDTDIVSLQNRLTALEAKAEADAESVWIWVKGHGVETALLVIVILITKHIL